MHRSGQGPGPDGIRAASYPSSMDHDRERAFQGLERERPGNHAEMIDNRTQRVLSHGESGRVSMTSEERDSMAEPQEFAVEVSTTDGTTIVRIRGEVDLYTAPKLRERLDEAVQGSKPEIVVDLGNLDFIDSTGLGVLVGALKQARAAGGDVSLRNPSRSTHKILEIAGLTELFTVE